MNTPGRYLKILLLVVTVFSVIGLQASAASADIYTTEAVLTDGVEGIDVNRSTTINARIWSIANVGDHMLVGGAFTDVRDRSSYDLIPKPYLAAFDPNTGEFVPEFRTQPNGTVYEIIDVNDKAILLGEFSSVNSVSNTMGAALVDPATGLVDTSLKVKLNNNGIIRAAVVSRSFLYLAGSFSNIEIGGVGSSAGGLARVNLNTMQLDTSWLPTAQGGGVWDVDVAESGRVFVGGYFSSINNAEGTETLAAINQNGVLVPGWNHGFPFDRCNLNWSVNCGAVNGLAVVNDRLFTAGAKHFWVAQDVTNGSVLMSRQISNDGQSVDVVDGMVVVGCHCHSTQSDEFGGITDRYIRVIDPVALTEVESPTVQSKGGAGGWAASSSPDSCMWAGGQFSSTFINDVQHPAWNLLRFCPEGIQASASTRAAVVSSDTSVPSAPTNLSTTQQASSITLSWSAASDNSGQIVYLVLRDGKVVARVSGTSYQDLLLAPGVHYWQVAAVDMVGNISKFSARSAPVKIAPLQNVALNAAVSQSTDFSDNHLAENAIDGDLNIGIDSGAVSRTTHRVDVSDQSWFNLDLGSIYDIDYVEVHPTEINSELNERLRIYRSEQPLDFENRVEASLAGLRVWTGGRILENPRIERADLVDSARYVRLLGGRGRLSIAEVKVFTTPVLPTPAAPVADSTAPTAPRWKSVKSGQATTKLSWGGATDNVGVVYYQVYKGSELIGTTSNRSLTIPGAGQLSRDFKVVSFDAANLNSGLPVVIPPVEEVSIESCEVVRNGVNAAVSWVAPLDADRFVVRRSVNGSSRYWRGAVTGSDREFTDGDKSAELRYFVEAKVANAVVASIECQISVEQAPAPAGLRSTYKNKNLVVLNWQSSGAVEIAVDGQVVATDSDKWYVVRNLSPGTTYSFTIRFAGSNSWSDPVVVTTRS